MIQSYLINVPSHVGILATLYQQVTKWQHSINFQNMQNAKYTFCREFYPELERPYSKPAVDNAVIFRASVACQPRPPCHASGLAAPVHAHFYHGHPSPASAAATAHCCLQQLTVTDRLIDRQTTLCR